MKEDMHEVGVTEEDAVSEGDRESAVATFKGMKLKKEVLKRGGTYLLCYLMHSKF